eukprot:2736854-Amphidinium_carterae.2
MAHGWSTSITISADAWHNDLEDMVPDAKPDAGNSAEHEWELHHRQGHITKWPDCPTCQKEAGMHRRKDPAERQTGVLHADLADMGLGHSQKRYVLVMAVTMCIDGAAVVMPLSSPLRTNSSEIVAQQMVEVILWLRNSPHTSALVGARVIRVMSDGGG